MKIEYEDVEGYICQDAGVYHLNKEEDDTTLRCLLAAVAKNPNQKKKLACDMAERLSDHLPEIFKQAPGDAVIASLFKRRRSTPVLCMPIPGRKYSVKYIDADYDLVARLVQVARESKL